MQDKNQISSLFRARLQTLLSERSVSQRQVALATGLSQQTINNYLRAVSKLPGAHELLVLSRYFGVPMEYFVTDENNQGHKPDGKLRSATSSTPSTDVRRAAERMHRHAKAILEDAEHLKKLG